MSAHEDLDVTLRDGTHLAVQRDGSGPPLLLLAGQANSHTWWEDLRGGFEQSFTTITFDYRGTGGTRAETDDTWSTASFARDAVAVLDACQVESAHVYATSMGGRVAQWLAADAPDRVDRLVLACTSPGGDAATERSAAVRRDLAVHSPVDRARALLHLMYTPAWPEQGRRSRLLGDPEMTPRARTLHLRASDAHDAAEALPRIVAPTLVLHGGADEMTPVANAHVLHEAIAGSQLRVFPEARHGFFDELAKEVSPLVTAFLG